MWRSEVSIDIEAPVSEVYQYLADFPRHLEWSSATMTHLTQLTAGPLGVGSEFEAGETVPGRLATRSRITALEPDRLIAWHSWWRNLTAVDWEFALSERVGGTHLVQRSRWRFARWIEILLWPLVLLRRSQIPVENRNSLVRIKSVCEMKTESVGFAQSPNAIQT